MNEKQFQVQVEQLAQLMGLLVYHTYDSRRSNPGFPDLVLVGGKASIYRELKTETGRLSPMQKHWLDVLRMAGQDADVWRPSDLSSGRIMQEMKCLGRVQLQQPLTSVTKRSTSRRSSTRRASSAPGSLTGRNFRT